MKVLLSTIGSRGEVQPILGLALELRALGHDATLVAPPDFKPWVESFGLRCVPIGPEVKKFSAQRAAAKPGKLTKTLRQQLAAGTVRAQFQVLAEAARDCDLIVGAGALQMAAPSIAEVRAVPYVWASYCPATLPSPDHPPLNVGTHYPQWLPGVVNRLLWSKEERLWNWLFRDTINDERTKAGLAPIRNVPRYLFTDRPWLATDAVLGPAPSVTGMRILQTGAWLFSDPTPLPDALERFLAQGEPPVYFGFGSMRAPSEIDRMRMLTEAARALGRRSVIAQGWADVGAFDPGPDGIVVGEINHERLLPRVAAVVHHGGAGTTTATARAGRPQVLVPHLYDQFYWAHRVRKLGVGVSVPMSEHLPHEKMISALRECLRPEVTARAREVADRIETRGARVAAERLVSGEPGDYSVPVHSGRDDRSATAIT